MQAAGLTAPVKAISWVDLILPIAVNKIGWESNLSNDFGKPFPLEKETSIRPAISGRIKLMHPDRVYKANKEVYNGKDSEYSLLVGKLCLIVRRIK